MTVQGCSCCRKTGDTSAPRKSSCNMCLGVAMILYTSLADWLSSKHTCPVPEIYRKERRYAKLLIPSAGGCKLLLQNTPSSSEEGDFRQIWCMLPPPSCLVPEWPVRIKKGGGGRGSCHKSPWKQQNTDVDTNDLIVWQVKMGLGMKTFLQKAKAKKKKRKWHWCRTFRLVKARVIAVSTNHPSKEL